MGGREEEERSRGISDRKPDRLHGRKTADAPDEAPDGKLAVWRTARGKSSVGFVSLRMGGSRFQNDQVQLELMSHILNPKRQIRAEIRVKTLLVSG